MDSRLKQALDFSNYNQTLSIQRKQLKEKIEAKLTYGYNGGIFRIDQSLISFVQTLINKQRINDIPLLDLNNIPVMIDDLIKFQDNILDRYFTSVYQYHEEYELLKKSRSVEKLINYE
jgi:hypothetical protein